MLLMPTQEHVVDAGTVYCSWRRRDAKVEECARCEAFRGLRETRRVGDRQLQIVECSPPVPLV